MGRFSLKGLLTAFDTTGEYLAISAGDGRVKTWDTVNQSMKGEFVDLPASTDTADPASVSATAAQATDGHLAMDYTCMAWNTPSRKGKKNSAKQSVPSLLALGTGTGDVLTWDAALGQLKWRTKNCHHGGVNSLAFSKSGDSLYTAGADGIVCIFDAMSGELMEKFRASKRAVSCIAVSQDGSKLVVGSSELRVFDLSSKKRIQKFSGHPDDVKALAFTEDAKYLVSSAVRDRHVAVWFTDENKSQNSAACALSLEHPAVSVDCSSTVNEGKSLRVLALSEAGVVYVWSASSLEDLSKASPVKISVASLKSSKSGKSRKPAVLAARLFGTKESGPDCVLVAYGTTVKPLFRRVSMKGQSEVILHADIDGVLLPSPIADNSSDTKIQQEATILGPDNAADAIQPKPHIEFGEGSAPKNALPTKKRRKASDESHDQAPPVTDGLQHKSDIAVDESGGSGVMAAVSNDEETIEDKLRTLGLIDGRNEDMSVKNVIAPPKADSLQVLLTQALEADDSSLLEQCLCVSDEKVIANTIRHLKSSDAAKFLQVSVFKMEARPKRALTLVPWIRAVLLHHAAYIMSSSSMQLVLSSLFQVIDARLAVFRSLLSLSGRLDLILAQLPSEDIERDTDVAEAAVIYEEESEDDLQEEVEDVMEDDMDFSDSEEKDNDDELDERKNNRDMKNDLFDIDKMDESEDDL